MYDGMPVIIAVTEAKKCTRHVFSSIFETIRCWVINQIRLSSNIETYQDTQVTVRLIQYTDLSLFIFEHVLARHGSSVSMSYYVLLLF